MLMLSFRWKALWMICQNRFHTLLLKLCPLLSQHLRRSTASHASGMRRMAAWGHMLERRGPSPQVGFLQPSHLHTAPAAHCIPLHPQKSPCILASPASHHILSIFLASLQPLYPPTCHHIPLQPTASSLYPLRPCTPTTSPHPCCIPCIPLHLHISSHPLASLHLQHSLYPPTLPCIAPHSLCSPTPPYIPCILPHPPTSPHISPCPWFPPSVAIPQGSPVKDPHPCRDLPPIKAGADMWPPSSVCYNHPHLSVGTLRVYSSPCIHFGKCSRGMQPRPCPPCTQQRLMNTTMAVVGADYVHLK